jgi:hypothetical protein
VSRSGPPDPPRRPTGAERRRAAAEALGAPAEITDILARYLKDGRLPTLPARRAHRMALLDYFAGLFEPGQVYPERDVNKMLKAYSDDTASIRRYLVDEEFLERRDNFYWRSGGSFDVD